MLCPIYPLLTERLSLRPFRDDDLDAFHAIQSRPDVVRYSLASEINRWIGISLTFAIVITLAMAVFEFARLVTPLRGGHADATPA